MALFQFNAASVQPQESLSPVPAGVYLAQVIESDVAPLKSGQGRALKLTFQILSGPYANRKVWSSLNVEHRGSAEAERIAQAQLSALCHSVGVINLQDTSQLHMKPVQIRVKVRKDETGQYGDKNEVTGYEAANGAGLPAAAQAPRQPAAAPAAPPAAMPQAAPWARRPGAAAAQGA